MNKYFHGLVRRILRLRREATIKQLMESAPADRIFIFWVTFVFYLSVWIIDPSNKLIIVFFCGLLITLYVRLRDVKLSLLLTYLISLVISTGKTYSFELVPPGVLPIDRWESGYVIFVVFSIKHIISVLMACILLRDLIYGRIHRIRISLIDILFILSFLWTLLSDLFGSKLPYISASFTLLSFHTLIAYLYLRAYLPGWKNFFPLFISWVAGMILFESLISFQQFIAAAPIGKNIEQLLVPLDFGEAIDEIAFRFRPMGTFAHANELGFVFSFFLPVLFSYVYTNQVFLYGFPLILGIITIVLTLSRGAWAALCVAMLFSLYVFEKIWKKKSFTFLSKYILAVFCLLLPILFIVALPRLENSTNTFYTGGGFDVRFHQIEKNTILIAQHPLFGVGTQMNVPELIDLDPVNALETWPAPVHNEYVLMMVENGIPSLLLFLAFVVLYMRTLVPRIHNAQSGDGQYHAIGLLAGSVSLFIIALIQPALDKTFIMLSFVLSQSVTGRPKQYEKNNP